MVVTLPDPSNPGLGRGSSVLDGGWGSAALIAFLEKEVQPLVAQHFRTNGVRTIIGRSAGGLLAAEILFKKPHMFDNYILVSPSLWWDSGSLTNTAEVWAKANATLWYK